MEARKQIDQLLEQSGSEFLRGQSHGHSFVWRLPNGELFFYPKTPSDSRAWDNQLANLRRKLRKGQLMTTMEEAMQEA